MNTDSVKDVYRLLHKHIYDRKNESMSDKLNSIMYTEWLYYKMLGDIWQLNHERKYCPSFPEMQYSCKWPFFTNYDDPE